VYVDASQVREGKLPELKAAMKELAEFVEANEPRLASYSVYFSEDGRRVSIIHVSPDTAALETHMDVAGRGSPDSRSSSTWNRSRSMGRRARQ